VSFYVRRWDAEHPESWTGPIRTEKQAHKEATAWQQAGWSAEVVPSTPAVRTAVRDWQWRKAVRR
jgi:hypothetical protein